MQGKKSGYPDKGVADWAKDVGVHFGPLPEDEKQNMIAELDAVAAHLCGLTERQFVHVVETYHEGWDCAPCLKAVLRHFHANRQHGSDGP